MKQIFAIVVLFTLFASCKSYKEADSNKQKYEVENFIVNKSPCFGTCPMYKLEVTKDGSAYLDARNFLKNNLKGKYTVKLSKENMGSLVKELNQLDFPKLNDKYGNNQITDLPATDLEIRYNGTNTKKIHDYGNRGTAELTKFYLYVDSLIYAQQWQKVN